MKDRGFTREQLAEKVGCHPITISKLISGKMKLTEDWMRRLSVALSARPVELMSADETGEQSNSVPILGYIGAGAEILPEFEQQGVGEIRFE